MAHIDRLLATASPEEVEREMLRLKPQIDRANTSTVCDKEELDVPVGPLPFNVGELVRIGAQEVWRMIAGDGRVRGT
jgi:hypothetical protein